MVPQVYPILAVSREKGFALLNGLNPWEQFATASAPAFRGMSVSVYIPAQRRWQQTWVDNAGSYLDFTGGWQEDRMVLSRQATLDGQPVIQRMVWFNITPSSLEWTWERSADAGASWQTLWHIHYRRRAAG